VLILVGGYYLPFPSPGKPPSGRHPDVISCTWVPHWARVWGVALGCCPSLVFQAGFEDFSSLEFSLGGHAGTLALVFQAGLEDIRVLGVWSGGLARARSGGVSGGYPDVISCTGPTLGLVWGSRWGVHPPARLADT